MKETALQPDWGGLSNLNFLHPGDFWQGIHVWKGHEDFHKNVALTVLDSAIALDDASGRPVLVSSLVIDEDLISAGDAVFD